MTNQRRILLKQSVATLAWAVTGASVVQAQPVAPGRQAIPAADAAASRAMVAKATRLSVLSDRITRSQAQRVLGVLGTRAERVLADSLAQARKLLSELGSGSLAGRPQFQAAAKAYDEFLHTSERFDIQDRPALGRFAVQADVVGDLADALVEALIKDMGQSMASILSTTADLQRLTQHLAVHFLLAQAGLDEKEQLKEVSTGQQAFIKHLADLRQAPLHTGPINDLLPLLDNQWMLMNQALGQTKRDQAALENTCTTSERTLEVLTSLYPQYESALKQVIGS
jgi:hypothetical protein